MYSLNTYQIILIMIKANKKMKLDVLNLVMVLMWNNSAFLAFVHIYVREKDPNGLSNIIHLELDSWRERLCFFLFLCSVCTTYTTSCTPVLHGLFKVGFPSFACQKKSWKCTMLSFYTKCNITLWAKDFSKLANFMSGMSGTYLVDYNY